MNFIQHKTFFFFLFLAFNFTQKINGAKVHIHIVNGLPANSPTLTIHCASGDDDLGYHDLPIYGDFNFSFRENIWGRTLYFCHFWCGSKDKSFVVFFDSDGSTPSGPFYYLVKDDGFYLARRDNPAPEDYSMYQTW